MRFLYNIAGIVGSECAVLLAIAAAVFVLAGHDFNLAISQFATDSF